MEKQQNEPGEIVSLLLKEGLLTKEKALYAMRVKSKLAPDKTLIDTLKDLKYINENQVKKVLRANHLSLRIGDLLVELGYLTREKLNAALNIQKTQKDKRIGQIIVENQFMSENVFIDALSVQLGFPFIDLSIEDVDSSVIENIPIKWCMANSFLPVKKIKGKILVAFADPFSKTDIQGARKLFGKNFVMAIAAPNMIEKKLEKLGSGSVRPKSVVDENTAIGIVETIIGNAIDQGASDIHIEPFEEKLQVRYRIDGILVPYKMFPANAATMVASRIKILCKANIAEKRRHQDGRMTFEHKGNPLDLRISIFVTVFGEKIVLRILNRIDQIIKFDQIGMQPKMLERFKRDVLNVPSGVLIITGPTGSGKTTTLYSCVSEISNPQISIVTAEDPVEYVVEGISQCSIDAGINRTFEETLRHIVRQDPDVIVIGEVRDNYSAGVAVHAALTGHKVLTSFHTEDSISGLIRLMNMEIEAFLISSTVTCVLAQRLLRRVCPHCQQPYKPSSADLKLLGYGPDDMGKSTLMKGRGCPICNHTGYKGRVAIYEMLVLNEFVREAILTSRSSYDLRKISIETAGLVTLMEDALSKVSSGITTLEEAFRCIPRLLAPRPIQEINRLLGVS
ncbi:MAG: Flp pilus assembly complex ATPase component TadA [Proteobacteria bacterium]|nr:secretion system protein E [Desulfobacula sp.]MBU4133627.1 Flp pilus assembly complex ATPase component TadA [Pseudomonadota bacterium]